VNGPLAPTFDGTGVPGGALRFDGSLSQHVDVPGGGGLDGTTVGTISMWAKWIGPQSNYHTGLNAPGAILSRQSDGTFSDNVIALSGTDPAAAGLTWRQNGAGPPIIIGGTAVGDDFWRHVAVRYSPGESELFLDGVSQGTAIGLPLNSNPLIPLSIGAWAGHGSTYSNSAIDDVAVFDDYLSATQINDLFTRTETPLTVGPGGPGVPPPFFGLVGHWEFEGNTLDSSGLDNHGTLEGAATVSGSDVPPIFGGTGALSLGGGGDHVLVDHHASLDITSEMTIAAWVKTTGDPAWDGIVAKAPSNGSASNSAGNY